MADAPCRISQRLNGIMRTMQENTWRDSLDRTRRSAFGQILTFLGQSDLTPDYWDNLEAVLVQSDLGLPTSQRILEELQDYAANEGVIKKSDLEKALKELLVETTSSYDPVYAETGPTVILLAGVNGSGKTTTAARLGFRFLEKGMKVLFAAADTYRAAAVEQLQTWGSRLEVDVISGQAGSDPGAVVYSASETAITRNSDILIIDTSGRMHTSHNLMAELEKIKRVCGRVINNAPHQTYLVIDATTGQNGLSQARYFTDQIGVDAVVLAKLDSSARGGIGLAIAEDLGLPIAFVGVGENIDDLVKFDPAYYIEGLLSHG